MVAGGIAQAKWKQSNAKFPCATLGSPRPLQGRSTDHRAFENFKRSSAETGAYAPDRPAAVAAARRRISGWRRLSNIISRDSGARRRLDTDEVYPPVRRHVR